MQTYTDLLRNFISFPSISTDQQYKKLLVRCADWLEGVFHEHGFQTKRFGRKCNPIIAAKFVVDPKLKTVLCYGHYDVQPAGEGWTIRPFSLQEKNGKLIGRGVVDNKGQVLIHITTVFDLIKENKLAYNVVFLIEGDEESGGGEVHRYMHDPFIKADHYIISDGEIPYRPMIEASFRGCMNCTLTVKTGENPLHSGLFGGGVCSATKELTQLLDSMYNKNMGTCAIPAFEKSKHKATAQELAMCKTLDSIRKNGHKKEGINAVDRFSETTAFSSCIEISGISGGYTANGYTNIVPNTAFAKINIRLAGRLTPTAAYKALLAHLKKNTKKGVTVTLVETDGCTPAFININTPIHRKTKQYLTIAYGQEPLTNHCGATIPLVSHLVAAGINPILVPLGNDDCHMHGPDENFSIELIKKGRTFSRLFFSDGRTM